MFLAADRELADEAYAGDIIGIPNHGQLRIGDTLTEGEAIRVTGIPSFAPELLQTCRAGDPLKAKHLEKALMQFAEEGAAKVFKPTFGSGFIVGVVGAALDNDGDTVFLTRLQWDIDRVARDYPDVTLSATKEMMV